MVRVIAGLLVLALLPLCAARTVPLGIFSFDTLIPGDADFPGVNAFVISNLTGDFSLDPEFPVVTPVELLDARVSLSNGTEFLLGSISPGSYLPEVLQFPENEAIESASFSARLATPSFLLADGATFTAGASAVHAVMRSSGLGLRPGVSFQLITVSDVPEPATGLLALAALGAALFVRRRSIAPRP